MADKTDRDIKRLKNIVGKVEEQSKIRLDQMMQDFLKKPDLKEITFPNQLTNMERAYVHYQASKNGLQSCSSGFGNERRLTLRRVLEKTTMESKTIKLTEESVDGIIDLKRAFPEPLFRPGSHNQSKEANSRQSYALAVAKRDGVSRLSHGPFPKIPRERRTQGYQQYRSRLPIWEHRGQIIELLHKHRVVFIKGSTGCGKTTQVGQFILDYAHTTKQKVRIICTVPRRIAAVSVSDRVALERGERLGQTVGYQIRLESCTSPVETLLTYCTSGILLRSLSAPDYLILKNTTHIIIDEIHERDRQTDFLLTCLRDTLQMFPDLRLIIMGADLNNELFQSYFGGEQECPIVQVEGRLYPVQTYYLEDVLDLLQYENYDMRSTRREDEHANVYNRLVQRLGNVKLPTGACGEADKESVDQSKLVKCGIPEVDDMIQLVWTTGDESAMADFLNIVDCQEVSVNYQHSSCGVTMLMACTVRGQLEYVSTLLDLGADLDIKSKFENYEFSAIDWAEDHNQHDVLKFLMEHQYKTKLVPAMNAKSMDENKSQRLTSYLRSIDEERVDLLLILRLLHRIHTEADPSNAILVFLPGYDEIVTLKHLIMTDNQLGFRHGSFLIFMLHSNIQTGDQRAAFEKPPRGMRKIVISTNIAESSLTFEDIVYVIDSGKAKEKSFDSLTCVTQLKSVWISKASVNQRRGRAGRCRPGICYHLFSSARYESMSEYPIPEIIRSSLQELCLQARSFMKADVKIERFFTRIPEPPAPIAVKKSVELLTVMGAIDEKEQLTTLGSHLLDFPLEPFLGKALIYAIVFCCLDPILTLVSVISYRDPFQLPSDPQEKQKAQQCKAQFSRQSLSDHMAYLKAFQDWEKSKLFCEGTERRFCRDNYLSSVTFEMVYAIRSQLLGQLRASGFVKTKGKSDLKELNVNSDNWALVKGVLVATLYPNICGVDKNKKVLYNSFNSKVTFHPSTTVTKKKNAVIELPTEWIIFDEMTQQGTVNYVKGCTCVSAAAIALFAGSFTSVDDNGGDKNELNLKGNCSDLANSMIQSANIKINQWITLEGAKVAVDGLLFLRHKIKDLVLKRLECPYNAFSDEEKHIIQTVAALLVSEDRAVGFTNVEGIGQWPKFVAGNLMSAPKRGFEKTFPVDSPKDIKGSENTFRYFVVEVAHPSKIFKVRDTLTWSLPAWLKDKFLNNIRAQGTFGQDLVIFFWCHAYKQFAGIVKLNGSAKLDHLPDILVDREQIISTKLISLQRVEREIGLKANSGSTLNRLELDSHMGDALMNMFLN